MPTAALQPQCSLNLQNWHVRQPASSEWKVSQYCCCLYATPQLLQRGARLPFRSSHPSCQPSESTTLHFPLAQKGIGNAITTLAWQVHRSLEFYLPKEAGLYSLRKARLPMMLRLTQEFAPDCDTPPKVYPPLKY